MPATYISIASTTLSSSAASVTFSAIPATYTDLLVRFSARLDVGSPPGPFWGRIRYNGSTAVNYSSTWLFGYDTNIQSAMTSNDSGIYNPVQTTKNANTANTFSNVEIYIPNYTGSTNKPTSIFGVAEDNGTGNGVAATAGLRSITDAITSITLTSGSNFVSGSTFHLYGIKNS